MTTYTVNMSNVQAVTDEMANIAQRLSTMLDQLRNESQATLAHWATNARDAFNSVSGQWHGLAGDMAAQAHNAQNALSQINDSYANAEFQGLGLWGA